MVSLVSAYCGFSSGPLPALSSLWNQDPDFSSLPSVFSSVIYFSLPLCLVLCLTILGIEEFLQQDAFNLREDMQYPELHTSTPKLQKLGKFPKIVCQVKYLTWLSYLPLLKLESALQMLRRVFHLATAHKKHVLISLNITHSCKGHCGVKGNVQCSGHLVNHSGSSMRLAFTSCVVLASPLLPIATFCFPMHLFHMFQAQAQQAFVYITTTHFTE